MTTEDALKIVQHFRLLCEQSIYTGEFTEEAYEEIIKGCDELRESSHYQAWGKALVLMIEDYDEKVDLTVGFPGYFGHAIESGGLEASCNLYIESLKRKPTGLIAGLASRAYRSPNSDCIFGLELFQSVLIHPDANLSSKEIAEGVLERYM